jgi:hypothetical protein
MAGETFRRFAGPVISFLVGSGLQVSGFTSVWLAVTLWTIAVVWGVIALLTWEPVRQIVRRFAIRRSAAIAERGFLDFMLDAERIPQQMVPVITRIAADTSAIGQRMNTHTQRLLEERARNRPDGTARIHKLTSRAAKDIRRNARRMRKHLAVLQRLGGLLAESYSGLAPTLRSRATNEEELRSLRESMLVFLGAVDLNIGHLQSYRDTVVGMRGTSRELNQASAEMGEVVEGILTVMTGMQSAAKTLIRALESNGPSAP